jgi:hypothetical protein
MGCPQGQPFFVLEMCWATIYCCFSETHVLLLTLNGLLLCWHFTIVSLATEAD